MRAGWTRSDPSGAGGIGAPGDVDAICTSCPAARRLYGRAGESGDSAQDRKAGQETSLAVRQPKPSGSSESSRPCPQEPKQALVPMERLCP